VDLGQQEIKFISGCKTNIELYFDADDFSVTEIADAVQKFIRDNFILKDKSVEFSSSWTRVPEIRHKWKLIRDNTLWDK